MIQQTIEELLKALSVSQMEHAPRHLSRVLAVSGLQQLQSCSIHTHSTNLPKLPITK